MKHSALHIAVLAAIGDKEGQMSLLSTAFAVDFGHFARSNNRADVESALLATGKSAKGKAIAMAIAAGFKSGALVQGYIGARLGKYASQPPAVQQPYEDALIRGCEAFEESLKASEAFKNSVPKTDAEKTAAKEAKEAKAAEAKEDILNKAVQDGTMIRASSVVVGQEMSYTDMVKMVIAGLGTASSDNLNALFGAVSAHVGMQAERDTLAEEAKAARALAAQTRSQARLRDAASRSLATADIDRQVAEAVTAGADMETIGTDTSSKKARGNRGRVHTVTLKAQHLTVADATAMVAVVAA